MLQPFRFEPLVAAAVIVSSAAALALAAEAVAPPATAPAEGRVERGALVMEGIPALPQALLDRVQPYLNTRTATLFDWDAGGGLLIGTRFGDTTQVHLVASPGGDRRQITFFNEPVSGARACPDPKAHGFLFVKDVGGGENFQIYYQDLDRGGVRLLTDGASRNLGPRWSNGGDQIAFASVRRDGRDQEIWVEPLADPAAARLVLKREGTWSALDWSPDDRRILVEREVSVNESYLHLLDPASGALEAVNPKESRIAYGGARFASDGRGLWLTSDEGSEFLRLRYWDIAKRTMTVMTADIPWDIEMFDVSRRGDRVAFTANEGGRSRLYLMTTKDRSYKPVAGVPDGVISSLVFDRDGRRLGFTLESATRPDNAYVLDLERGEVTRWTDSETGGLPPDRFVAPTLVDYPTFDQVDGRARRIPAYYFRPAGQGPFPVIISIHGGPEGQYRPNFSATLQYFASELGAAVLAPNVRGSTGYGKSYVTLDNGMKREDSVADIGALLDWIATRPELDARRVAVYGGSYGGFMVLSCLTHFPDWLSAAIDVVGISNFVSFLKNTSGYRQDLRRVEYGDERDPDMRAFLERISPLTNVGRIRTPVFIVQGLNDPRVPYTESEQMLDAVKKSGVPAWYLMAKDEGHGFRKKSNTDFLTGASALFLKTYLVGRQELMGGEEPESLQKTFSPQGICFGCGPANPAGLHVESRPDGDTLVAVFRPGKHHEAFPGYVSGGIIGTLLDCHSNWTAAWTLMRASGAATPPFTVTADYHVRLLRPAPSDGPLRLRAKAVEVKDDRAVVEATLEAGGKLCATCRGTFVAVQPGHPAYQRW